MVNLQTNCLQQGAPSRLIDRGLPITISKDKGIFFVDQNACRAREYPFEPIFQAMNVMNPEFSFTKTDLVTNRNSLRKLFNVIAGKKSDSFRLQVDVVHDTLFLSRHERHNQETLGGQNVARYGHTFEQAVSEMEPELTDSTAHHRVIQYQMGSLNCVVRFEVDTFRTEKDSNGLKPEIVITQDHDIQSLFEKLSIDESPNQLSPEFNTATSVVCRGHLVPCSATAELKMRSGGNDVEIYKPQLWFSRTPYLICGHHNNGKFTKVETIEVMKRLEDWEEHFQAALCKIFRLIITMRQIAMKQGGHCVAIYDRTENPAKIVVLSSLHDNNPLPDHLIKRYWK
jgi:hypothetical protein